VERKQRLRQQLRDFKLFIAALPVTLRRILWRRAEIEPTLIDIANAFSARAG
jgi:hypothetical protein